MAAMSDDGGDNPKTAARKAREERLAAALRANLRRRKAANPLPPEPAADAEAGEAVPERE